MASVEDTIKKDNEKLYKELSDFQIKNVVETEYVHQDEQTAAKQAGQRLKAAIPFMKGRYSADRLISRKVSTKYGEISIVSPYARTTMLPAEYIIALGAVDVPYSVIFKRGLIVGSWSSEKGDKNSDDFCLHLSNIQLKPGLLGKNYDSLTDWNQELGRMKLKLDWTIQLIPAGNRQAFLIYKRPYSQGFFGGVSKYGVDQFIDVISLTEKALKEYTDHNEIRKGVIMQHSLGILTIPELLDLTEVESIEALGFRKL